MTLADRKLERRMWVDLGNDEIPTLLDEMKKVFMISYGGGHANIMRYVCQELKKRRNVDIVLVALTTAPILLRKFNVDYITVSQLAESLPYYDEVVKLGKKYGMKYHNKKSGILPEDTIAYYGIGLYDLIQSYGEKASLEIFEAEGRKVFLPVCTMRNILYAIRPDVSVITASPRMEMATGIASADLGIPVIRINDIPITKHVPHDCTLCVMNEWARDYAVNHSGLSENKIVITGQPVFEGDMTVDKSKLDAVKEKLSIDKYRKIVTFFTENGLNQDADLSALYTVARDMSDTMFIVKLHPNQSFDDILHTSLKNVVLSKDDAQYFLHFSDLAITTFSTTGMEAAMMDIPVISVNFYDRNYIMDYGKMRIAKTAVNQQELRLLIKELLNPDSDEYKALKVSRKSFSYTANAASNIADLVLNF